jgi:hypothetical protein
MSTTEKELIDLHSENKKDALRELQEWADCLLHRFGGIKYHLNSKAFI